MDNLASNFQTMMDYYVYSGKIVERLIAPFLLVVLALIVIRILFGFFFKIDTRLRAVKNLNRSYESISRALNEQSTMIKETKETLAKMSASYEKLLAENNQILASIKENIKEISKEKPLKEPQVLLQKSQEIGGDE